MQIHGECGMALNVEQLQALQDKIGSKPVMPDSLSRLSALEDLENIATNKLAKATDPRYSRRFRNTPLEGGGQPNLSSQAQNVAKAGRMGDSMLMHVSPSEVRGLSSLRPVTKNPETGLPEAIGPFAFLAAAGAAGAGTAAAVGTAAAGAGIMSSLGGMWASLGPIGQGMLIGGGMGGLKSLFMGGQNPLKDILIGAALGGVGGYFGAGTGADLIEGGALGPTDMATIGGPVAPTVTAVAPLKLPSGEIISGAPSIAQGGSYLGYRPQAAVLPSAGVTSGYGAGTLVEPFAGLGGKLPQPAVTHAPGFYGAPYAPTGKAYVRPPIVAPAKQIAHPVTQGYTSDAARQAAIEAAKTKAPATDKTFFGGLKDWWKEREWYEKAGITGLGALAATELLSRPGEQQELEGLKPIQPFAEADPKVPLKPISPLTEEQLVAAYTGPSGTGIDTYFQRAKKGGIVSLQRGGIAFGPTHGGAQPAPPGYTYVPGRPYEQPQLKKTSEVGGVYVTGTGYGSSPTGATLLKGATMGEAGRVNIPDWERAGDTGAAADAAASESFKFPDVTPFQSRVSSFNLEDRLARITGQDQVPQVPVVLPEQVAAPVPTDIGTPSALENLLSRFQQTAQVDPIAGLVAPAVGVKQGGTIERPTGGLLSILFDKEQRRKFDPWAALSPLYALKEDKYPEYYMPWQMIQGLARGGVFEGRVQGQGDGMADKVAFNVTPQTPQDAPNTPDVALLSSDEYVVPADVVSMLGNGSSTAGAKSLDKFNQLMRRKAHGTNRQQRELNAGRELSSLV